MNIQSIQAKIKYLGCFSLIAYTYEIMYNSFLRSIYKFDKWHVISPHHSRIYKSMVVNLVNNNISASDIVV